MNESCRMFNSVIGKKCEREATFVLIRRDGEELPVCRYHVPRKRYPMNRGVRRIDGFVIS